LTRSENVLCGLPTWNVQYQLLLNEVAWPLLAVAGLVEELQTPVKPCGRHWDW